MERLECESRSEAKDRKGPQVSAKQAERSEWEGSCELKYHYMSKEHIKCSVIMRNYY